MAPINGTPNIFHYIDGDCKRYWAASAGMSSNVEIAARACGSQPVSSHRKERHSIASSAVPNNILK